MESFIIRDATKKDVETLADYCLALLEYHYELDPDYKPNNKAREAYFSYLTKSIKSNDKKILIAEVENKVIGFALGEIQNKPPVLALGKYGFISDVYVVDSYRKKGISKQLISKLYLWFEKKRRIFTVLIYCS
ncbi:MAG: GNAT family N-acetyltransferase [Nanoarchaeota archaeon]|nr:GNAT family N-acetyltransferase [Nanoarchaeota archaeon]MBU1622676.1 GNAT family N-acetyltransferase [Nanoarchaeota archaeon]